EGSFAGSLHNLLHFCSERNFELASFSPFPQRHMTKYRIPIGLRGIKGFSLGGEVLFFKKAQHILENHSNPLLDLFKIAFISFIYFRFDKTYEYIEAIKKLKNSQLSADIALDRNYLIFMLQLIQTTNKYPHIFPIRFRDLFYSSELRRGRFSKNHPDLDYVKIRKKYFQDVNIDIFKAKISENLSSEYIGIEQLCEHFKLKEHADLLKENRTNMSKCLLTRLGLFTENEDGKAKINLDDLQ
ncbi:MAG: hypothetical protein HQK65_22545, partial [Desulfamplus sp.]|nr:hypothetical protein [Desulfamplus sp.]